MKFKLNNVFPNKDRSFQIALILTVIVFFVIATPTSASAASVAFDSTSYAYNSFPAKITVIDPNADVSTSPDTVSVTVTSDSDPVGITLVLTETGDETGEFRNTWLVFMDDNNLFQEDSTITVTYNDPNLADSGTLEIFVASIFPPNFGIDVRSIVDPFILTETTPGDFEAQLTLTSTGPTTDTDLEAVGGDIISASFPCDTSNGLVVPNPDPTVGAIMALNGDTVTVTYEDTDSNVSYDVATVDDGGGGCGGSGGGLVINRVVLDVLAGGTSGGDFIPPQLTIPKLNLTSLPLVDDILDFILNADSFTPITPLDDPSIDYPVSINDNGYLLTQHANTIQTYQGKTGESISFKMTLFDATGIEHIGLYTNLRGDQREIQDSDTYFIYNEDRPLEITDPHGLFSNVNFTESEYNGKYLAEFNMTFAKPMDTSDVIIRTWDELLNSGDIKIFDAIKIEGEPIVNPDTNDLVLPESSSITIPYYKLPYYEIPEADVEGNLIYYNSFGGLEEKQVHPYRDPIVYPDNIGKAERHDDGYQESIINEETRAQTLAQSLIGNSFISYEDSPQDVKFYYSEKVGKLDRQNKEILQSVKLKEFERATKIFNQYYKTNHISD